ncbi:MAG: AMP-binding protein [Alphaproteobacteria bacterium]|nr:AMP-binding protein [Alphaproteobacteria bacterium]
MNASSTTLHGTPWLDGLTIGQALSRTAARFAERDAIIFAQQGLRLNYREYDAKVTEVAKGLLAMGIKPGEHIGVWATNIPQWVLLQYGAARAGIVLVTINPAYRPFELSYTIAQSDIVALFLTDQFKSSDYYAIFTEACPEITSAHDGMIRSEAFPKLRLAAALKPNAPSGYLAWEEMLKASRNVDDATLEAIGAKLSAHDVINIQYTSGTTGFPKAAMLTHRNILMNAYYVTGCQNISENDRMCVPVPFYHCFGCVMGSLGAVSRGAALVVPAEYFQPAATLEALEKERCTTIYGVPTMFVAMLDEMSKQPRTLPQLRSGIMAGSPCPIEVMKKVIDVMNCREITIAYGQTETSPVVTQSRTDDSVALRVETVGREIDGVEIEIRNPETGVKVSDGEQGELCARGHTTMRGYYKNPEATAITIDKDGWVHTGDLAIRRPDGYFKITGRLKDMVIRGGENIYPREIEEFLFTHPDVAQAAVFGVPDAKYGEELCAWVQLHPQAKLDEETLRAFCKKSLAHYKVPRYIQFVDSFPTTVSGKIQKFKMREQVCEALKLQEQKTA